ncbi:hypothetical protein HD806DRAFT_153224 [Xylariaceae sp. AK1471]|nr:hypothetical protein HD806DRAFT_153224 [Xylariaceae sp. AK1471]
MRSTRCQTVLEERLHHPLKPFAHIPFPTVSTNTSNGTDSKSLSRRIRLLRLIPSNQKDFIECHIKEVDLKKRPKFDALSYTWGPPTQARNDRYETETRTESIVCNGRELSVTQNLFQCLLQLDADKYYDRDLWVDAICVNQEDTNEQCQQVSIMADIFHSAETVIVWLGEADDFTKPAYNLIHSFYQLTERDTLSIELHTDNDERNSGYLRSINSPKHWRAVVNLFGRRWFKRAWCVQEIVLAQVTKVLCGSYVFDWDAMIKISHVMATQNWANTFKAHLDDWDASLLSYKNPTKLQAIKEEMKGRNDKVFLHALIRCRSFESTKNHDKVYSVLGLVAPEKGQSPNLLYPNYDHTVARVYTDATKYILKNDNDLHVLAHVEGDVYKNIQDLPSWVPDWSVREDLGLRITGYERYKAAGGMPCLKELTGGDRLILRGAQLATVSRIGVTKQEVNDTMIFEDWFDILAELEREFPERNHRDALWRTLIGDTNPHGKVPVEEPWEDALYIWAEQRENITAEEKHRAAAYHKSFAHSLHLCLFRTNTGHLGLGSQSCREGDLVWIVAGSRVPLILRRVTSEAAYSLVGGVYIHGFMQGEALEPSLTFERFTLV